MKLKGWMVWGVVVISIWSAVAVMPDKKLRVTVCDVGQGDGILISRGTEQMVIDGGPNAAIIDCLDRHMPFFDRRIEVVILTHPEADHLTGLIDVVERYTVLQFVSSPIGKQTDGYRKLMAELNNKQVPTRVMYAGDKIKLGEQQFDVVWPEREWVEEQGLQVLGWATDKDEVNGYAVGGILKYGGFKMMFTGDADQQIEAEELAYGRLEKVAVVKVPHHGSKTGMTKEWLEALGAKAAVISVGKNSYGHPTVEALKLLSDEKIKTVRTDQEGDIEIVSDGQKWSVK